MPSGVGGGILTNPAVKPTDGSVWANVGGAWQAASLATLLATNPLPSLSGGTGVANAGTFTNPVNSSVTGGGTLALGGFTLTVPATGTAGLLGTIQTWSAVNTFTAQTLLTAAIASTTPLTGTLVVTGGVGITGAVWTNGKITISQPIDPGFALNATGIGKTWNSYIQSSTNQHWISSETTVADWVSVTNTTGFMTLVSSVDATSTALGSLVTGGGIAAAKSIWCGATAGNFVNVANATGGYRVNNTQVAGPRIAGYGTPTGNVQTASFPGATATLAQTSSELAQLILDLKTHGLLGT